MASVRRAIEYKMYRLTIYNARDLIEGKFEVAALDRESAQAAGHTWADKRGMTGYRVSVMRKFASGEPSTVLVVT